MITWPAKANRAPWARLVRSQHAVGERIAERQQRVERANVEAVQKLLQEIEHARPAAGAAAVDECGRI